MKILMIGEFSGFFNNLKQGFEKLGQDVLLIASHDGWKKISGSDITISSKLPSIFGKISVRAQYIVHLFNLEKYDSILIINPNIGFTYISKIISYMLDKKSKNIYLTACGTDIEYVNYGSKGSFDYWPFEDCENAELSPKVHNDILSIVDYVIPTLYDYAEPWRNSKYGSIVLDTIPLPINVEKIKITFPKTSGKIIFFHGLNSECKKGSKYIIKALKNVEREYPDRVTVLVDGHMKLESYLKLMEKVDVVIDQCKVYSYGSMNSLYALSMGKILMAGFRDECKNEHKIRNKVEGIINIYPDVKYIEKQLKHIIENQSKFRKWGAENRKFVIKKHSYITVANNYLNVFKHKNK